jgi:hypothetical protein
MTNFVIIKDATEHGWSNMVTALKDCVETPDEHQLVQTIQDSNVLTHTDLVDFFDDNRNGRLDVLDHRPWQHHAFFTKYVDNGFLENLTNNFQHVMDHGMAVDQIRLLNAIQNLPYEDEITLLASMTHYETEPAVLIKAYVRLEDLNATEILSQDNWVKTSRIVHSRCYNTDPFHLNNDIEASEYVSDYDIVLHAKKYILDKSHHKTGKESLLEGLETIHIPEVEAFLKEIVSESFDMQLKYKALKLLSSRRTKSSLVFLKNEILRKNDFFYQAGKLFGINTDDYTLDDNKDKQGSYYKEVLHEAFCSNKYYDATRDVRDLLAQGHTDFRYFDMTGADLSGFDFSGTNLYRANLSHTDLTNTNLSNIDGHQNIIIIDAKIEDTNWHIDLLILREMFEKNYSDSRYIHALYKEQTSDILLFQKNTQYFTCEDIVSMLSSSYTEAFELGLNFILDGYCDESFREPLLLQILEDKPFKYRQESAAQAIIALNKNIGQPSLDDIVFYLDHQEYEARRNAAYILGVMNDPTTVEPLMNRLLDKNEYSAVYEAAATALAKIHNQHSCVPYEPLLLLLKDPEVSNHHKEAIIEFMGKTKMLAAAPALWTLLLSPERTTYYLELPQALAEIHNEHNCITETQIKDALKSDNETEIVCLLRFLRNISPPETIAPIIIEIMQGDVIDSSYQIELCLDVLRKIHDSHGTIPVSTLLSILDTNDTLSYVVARLIGYMRIKEAVPILLKHLENAYYVDPAHNYAHALSLINSEHHCVPMDQVIAILYSKHMQARRHTAMLLGWCAAKEAIPELIKYYDRTKDDLDSPEWRNAANALKQIHKVHGCVPEEVMRKI